MPKEISPNSGLLDGCKRQEYRSLRMDDLHVKFSRSIYIYLCTDLQIVQSADK